MRITLVRHPRPLVADGICYGRIDLPLHPGGMARIVEIVEELAVFGPVPVWSSPSLRCRATASAIAAGWDMQPVFDDRLRELDFGAWEGKAWDDVPRDALDRWAADPHGFAPPGGESGEALIQRVTAFHMRLRDEARNAVVVSHGGPLKLLLALLQGREVDLLAPPPDIGAVVWAQT